MGDYVQCFDCGFDAEVQRTCGACGAIICDQCYDGHACIGDPGEIRYDAEPETQEIHQIYPQPAGLGFFSPRCYQHECADAIYEAWTQCNSTLAVMATGMGKTIVFAEVALRWPEDQGRVLVIAHMDTLIQQACEKLALHMDEHPGIEKGQQSEARQSGHSLLDRSKVLVSSVQTMSRESRRKAFDPFDFGLLIIDEAHHAISQSYRNVINYFRRNPRLKILGVTATPKRHDKMGMHNVFDTCCFDMGIRCGIDEGWLCDIEQRYVIVEGLDFSGCKKAIDGDMRNSDVALAMMGGVETVKSSGELTEEQKEALEKQEKMLHAVVTPTIKEAEGRSTLVMAATIDHAERLTEIFNRHPGVTAACIHSGNDNFQKTDPENKEMFVRQFQSGQLQILVGVGSFTEGFDAPATVLVAIARPTSSESLYIQMIGRGTRPVTPPKEETAELRKEAIANSRKPACIVLDFVGNSGRHKLVSVVDVLAGTEAPEIIERAKEIAKEAEAPTNMRKAIDQAKDEERIRQEEERKRKELAEHARRERVRAEAEYRTKKVDLFSHGSVPERPKAVFRGGASDAQVKYLVSLGVAYETAVGFNSRQAGAVITEKKKRRGAEYICTFKKHAGKALKDIPPGYIEAIRKMDASFPGKDEFLANADLMKSEGGLSEAS